MEYQSIKSLSPEIIGRWSSGVKEVDWLYGYSRQSNGRLHWGMPFGSIALYSGAGGIGKSRVVVEICKSMCNKGLPILYCQNEMSDFGGKVKNSGNFRQENFYLTKSADIDEQLKMAIDVGAFVVVVDSLSILEAYGNGASDRVIKSIHAKYREYADMTQCHIIWLCHMNKEGKIKGRTTLTHLVDTDFLFEHYGVGSYIVMKVGDKHRYGRTGENYKCLWTHRENSITCDSTYRYTDSTYSSQYGFNPIGGLDALGGFIPQRIITPNVTPKSRSMMDMLLGRK